MFLAYAVRGGGRALIDRELYLPESWTSDRDRCRQAGIGDDVEWDALAGLVPAAGWQRISCGEGAKGPRFYDWALIATASAGHHLLIRRPATGGELTYFFCHAPAGTALADLVRVAGARWAIEECFQAAKNETGLHHYQVRRYDAWYRHATLSMLAMAFLAVTAAQKGYHRLWGNFPGHQARMIMTSPSLAQVTDKPHCRRDPPLVRHRHPAQPPARLLPAMVTMAQAPPAPRPKIPLPATTATTSQPAAAVPGGTRDGRPASPGSGGAPRSL